MRIFLRLFLVVVSLVLLAHGYVHQCELGTDPTVCSLWNFSYRKKDNLPSVNIPSSVKKVHIKKENYYYRYLAIDVYDSVLHSTILHNPSSVQIDFNHIDTLHMPTDLQIGEFQYNLIADVLINSSLSYAVTYLDLRYNTITNIVNLSALLNLKTLNLEGNLIREVKGTTFASMQNLSMLYLGVNSIQKLDFKGFPKALTELWLFDNRLTDLNLDDVFLPALAVLDLRRNFLKTIDLKAVFVDLPGLKFLPIARNQFKEDEVNRIITGLNQHNVSHYYGLLKADCSAPEEFEVSNICLRVATEPYQEIGMSIWKALVLLVFGVILVGMFVGSLRWIWYQFRY